jgi:hypothetical protein
MSMPTNISVILSFLIFPLTAFTQKISGRVLNEVGKPANYVTVQFNKSNSVFTNPDGTFMITAKKLPDTLFFFAPGFESYKVLVTEETTKDSHFEVVLLNTRRKIKSSDVSSNANANIAQYNNASNQASQGKPVPAEASYVFGKKLFMIDTVANNGSVIYKSGLLTASEVNDFNKWKLWQDFPQNEYKIHSDHWGLYPEHRYTVQVQNKDHTPLSAQSVFLIDKRTNDTIWSAVTDNTGKAELWADMKGPGKESEYRIVADEGGSLDSPVLFTDGINVLQVDAPCSLSPSVDIAVVVDATGSMSNEIDFLKIELEEVIRNTFSEYKDLDLHVGSVFYRDRGDEYITRYVDFQSDLLKVLNFIKLQRASGGGDVPEAVHLALQTALDSLHWSTTARSRILFLVTDAPPHDEAKDKMFQMIQKAAQKGVRIIPVICKGADKSTEFIMRSMALATNGTYVFLTDDPNAQFTHSKPGTDVFYVQFLNSVLGRIIKQMVVANSCSAQNVIEISNNGPGNIQEIKVTVNTAKSNITIESKTHLKEVFIADFTGKILKRIPTTEKQTKWTADLSSFPNGSFLVRYITDDDQWGTEKFVLSR